MIKVLTIDLLQVESKFTKSIKERSDQKSALLSTQPTQSLSSQEYSGLIERQNYGSPGPEVGQSAPQTAPDGTIRQVDDWVIYASESDRRIECQGLVAVCCQ